MLTINSASPRLAIPFIIYNGVHTSMSMAIRIIRIAMVIDILYAIVASILITLIIRITWEVPTGAN